MRTIQLNGKTLKIHDSVETMPITVFHRFNLYAAMDAGIGGTIEDVDRRLYRVRQFIAHDQRDNAIAELDNMRQAIAFVIENSNPELLSFAALVESIDGQAVQVDSAEDAQQLLAELSKQGLTIGKLRKSLDAAKKKWMQKWRSIFRSNKNQRG